MTNAFQNLTLERPLCVLDLETTGLDPRHHRIVEVALVRFDPGAPAPRQFRRERGRVVLAFGKYAGTPLATVARRDPGYLRWLLGQGPLDDARALIEQALRYDPGGA